MKKSFYIFAILLTLLSCNPIRQTIAFQKETGFSRSTGCYYVFSDIEKMNGFSDFDKKEIQIKNSQLHENKGVILWQGMTINIEGGVFPFVDIYELDSIGLHHVGKSDRNGVFCIKTRNTQIKGFYLDSDHVTINRGFSLGEEEICIEASQVYISGGFVHWQGKTIDKEGEDLPYVNFYAVDSILKDDEQFSGHFLGTADKHGNFKIKDRTKSCKGFYIDFPGYLGTVYIMTSEHSH